jgi:3-deoxy-D-manno-octulosonic-acid transferase
MLFFYTLFIYIYGFLISFASIFNKKARLWKKGRKNIWTHLTKTFSNNTHNILWFHVSSLGEFEQARPLIEKIKMKPNNQHKIFITFFSPSGYEIRKDYEYADYVFYLPLDTSKNAKKLLQLVKPVAVFWVKYDFWFHYLKEIQQRNIPSFLFSAVFNKNQFLFKWYGKTFLNILRGFNKIFVQDEESLDLLENQGFNNAVNVGDTRFDRVKETAQYLVHLPEIVAFKQNKPLLVVGSCWESDLDILIPFLNRFEYELKVIIAPHELKRSIFNKIESELALSISYYSAIKNDPQYIDKQVLIIDNIGMLSKIYAYADIAYVGGAFGEGLHNILEPATFGVPIILGEDYEKFPEAVDLIEQGGAFSVQNQDELELYFDRLYLDIEKRQEAGKICKHYVEENAGSTEKIFKYFFGEN